MFDFTSFQRTATAAIGAIILSTACVAAAVGPGHAVQPQAAAGYAAAQVQVSDRSGA